MKQGTMYQTFINIYLILHQYKITLRLIYQIKIKHQDQLILPNLIKSSAI